MKRRIDDSKCRNHSGSFVHDYHDRLVTRFYSAPCYKATNI